MDEALGEGPFALLVDLGTGTGRILELFGPRAGRALGFDLNHDMLAYARMKLERAGLAHAKSAMAISKCAAARRRSRRGRAASGAALPRRSGRGRRRGRARARARRKLLVVDFAPHELEFLREQSAHRRLGFARDQLDRWLEAAGLKVERFRELAPRPAPAS